MHHRRKRGAIIKSRNRVKEQDDNPIETRCPYCNHTQEVTEDNIYICGTQTKTYWCESCGELYWVGMKLIDYKYS